MSKTVFYLLISLIIVGLVYLLQIRPGNIRSRCAKVALNKEDYNGQTANYYYRLCLAESGMKPENLN